MEVCVLTLSEKFGEKCVVCYDNNNEKLIRIVSDFKGTGIPEDILYGISCLDIIEVDMVKNSPIECQQENVKVNIHSIKKTNKKSNISLLQKLSKKNLMNRNIFGNTIYKLNSIANLNYSIEIIEFQNMKIYSVHNDSNKIKTKANFKYNNYVYTNFSITDSRYYEKEMYIDRGYAVITIPVSDEFTEKWGYFKFISSIFVIE